MLGLFIFPFLVTTPVRAVDVLNGPCSNGAAGASSVCNSNGASGTPTNNAIIGPNGIITKIIEILSIVIGAVAIIMIVISAFRMVISGGDTNAVNSARDSLIYSLVGLAVAALSAVIVEFVLSKV